MDAAAFTEALGAGERDRSKTEARIAARLLAAASALGDALAPGDQVRSDKIAFAIARLGGRVSIDDIARARGILRADVSAAIRDVIAARETGRAFDAAIDHAQKAMIHLRRAAVILEEHP